MTSSWNEELFSRLAVSSECLPEKPPILLSARAWTGAQACTEPPWSTHWQPLHLSPGQTPKAEGGDLVWVGRPRAGSPAISTLYIHGFNQPQAQTTMRKNCLSAPNHAQKFSSLSFLKQCNATSTHITWYQISLVIYRGCKAPNICKSCANAVPFSKRFLSFGSFWFCFLRRLRRPNCPDTEGQLHLSISGVHMLQV